MTNGANTSHFTSAETYRHIRKPVEEATTLPPDCYRSEECFNIERDKVFSESWFCIGYTSQVDEPGKMHVTEVSGQPIVVTMDKQNNLRAFYNVCRHRGSLLVAEDTKLERFRCPYHSWTYDLTGKLLSCPLFTAASSDSSTFSKSDHNLFPIRVDTWGCFIFVNLSQKAPPLDAYLGDLIPDYKIFPLKELVLVKRKQYSVEANWKLIAENFLEYYHLPWVHPELTSVTAIDLHKRNQGSGTYMSFYASPLLKAGTPIDADYLPPMPGLDRQTSDSGYFPAIFPNLAMFIMPHHIFTLLMLPNSAQKTQEYGDLLVHPSVLHEPHALEKIDAIFQFYDMVNIQDINAVERVQKGIQARPYLGGRMNHRFEEPVHRFQNMVADYMLGDRKIYAGDFRQNPK